MFLKYVILDIWDYVDGVNVGKFLFTVKFYEYGGTYLHFPYPFIQLSTTKSLVEAH